MNAIILRQNEMGCINSSMNGMPELNYWMSSLSVKLIFVSLKETNHKMEQKQKKGLLALLGIGAGAFAWWKYKTMSPEKKEQLHSKVNEMGQKVKDTVHDVETTVKDKYDQLKKLKELLDAGAITQDEYDSEKKKILSNE